MSASTHAEAQLEDSTRAAAAAEQQVIAASVMYHTQLTNTILHTQFMSLFIGISGCHVHQVLQQEADKVAQLEAENAALQQEADKVAQLEAENAALQQQLNQQDAAAHEASLQQHEHSAVFGDKLRIAASRVLAFKVFAAAGPIFGQSTALLVVVGCTTLNQHA